MSWFRSGCRASLLVMDRFIHLNAGVLTLGFVLSLENLKHMLPRELQRCAIRCFVHLISHRRINMELNRKK